MNNVLQALIYFFKQTETGPPRALDEKALLAELNQLGVSLADLEETFSKIALLIAAQPCGQVPLSSKIPLHTAKPLTNYPTQPHAGTRIFSDCECARISKKSREFLVKMEHMGILTPTMREKVIDQLIEVETPDDQQVRLSHTKWIMFQLLFYDAPQIHVAYLEWLLFGEVMEVH